MGYIKEIQGLRAVAALLVAVYHIWLNRVSGGVDAFFVIAAFFLMSSFARIGEPTGQDVLRYYASTVRRVFPLAAVVILATIAGTLLLVPSIHWSDFALHAFASTIFVENWWLAWTGTDYLRLGFAASPFQQMWALSLQMQYYVVLPMLLWGVASFAMRRGTSVRAAWTAALTALLVISFTYNLWVTATKQPWAYFDSFARGWEYMLGALLALHIDRLPVLSRHLARLLGYGCLILLVSFAAVIPVANLFPGKAALIPVLSTLGLIVAARAGAGILPLTNKPILALGEISFSFYLWHWPLLIFWRQWTNDVAVGIVPGLAIIGFAGVLALGTLRLLEAPFRRWQLLAARPALSVLSGVLVMLPAIAAIYSWSNANSSAIRDAQAQLASFVNDPTKRSEGGSIVPDPLVARYDAPGEANARCQQALYASPVVECSYGRQNASRTIVLVGNSHAMQWLPALQRLAPSLDARIVTMTKSDCPLLDTSDKAVFMAADDEVDFVDASSCLDWNVEAFARLTNIAPDLILTISTAGAGAAEAVPEAFRTVWSDLVEAGIPILAIRDNPRFAADVVECVARFKDEPKVCDESTGSLISSSSATEGMEIPGVTFADLTDLFCDKLHCFAVRDDILVYRDRGHLTATFVRVHAERLGREIEAIIGGS